MEPVLKRAPVACTRCRQLKIRCTGQRPCEQCTNKGRICKFDDRTQKVTVSKSYLHDLEKRLASLEHDKQDGSVPSRAGSTTWEVPDATMASRAGRSEVAPSGSHAGHSQNPRSGTDKDTSGTFPTEVLNRTPDRQQSNGSPEPGFSNPFGLAFAKYYTDRDGKSLYFGTSSNYAFGRRVLSMAWKCIHGVPLPLDNLLFEGKVYDLGLDGKKKLSSISVSSTRALPAQDFAAHLIKLVDFHCGHLFYLFDEELFMQQFALFHEKSPGSPDESSLWFVHYLLVLSFGKAYAVQTTTASKAAGTDLFIQAMQLLPDFMFIGADPIELIQVLCCAALFLHCLEFRCAAYKTIGWALRLALENGLHSDMQSQYIDQSLLQRCRKLWWTVYVLDQQMSTLMGVPPGVPEESIAALLPDFPNNPRKLAALDIQINLHKLLANILHTIYGPAGHFNKRFLSAAKDILKKIASFTERLNQSFDVSGSSRGGISRLSAYLHLQYHQCVILTTRPILYIFLEVKLSGSPSDFAKRLESNSIRRLLQVCIESAQQTLTILGALLEQTLLESFLPFDLESIFISMIVILMANAVGVDFVKDISPWAEIAYGALDEMIRRGNLVAVLTKSELQQLEGTLSQLPIRGNERSKKASDITNIREPHIYNLVDPGAYYAKDTTQSPTLCELPTPQSSDQPTFLPSFNNAHSAASGRPFNQQTGVFWQDSGFTAEQLLNVADSIDLNGLEWLQAPNLDTW